MSAATPATRSRVRFALIALSTAVLGLSYYWAIWDTADDAPWARWAWAVILAQLVGAQFVPALRAPMAKVRQELIRALPALCLGSLIAGVGTLAVLWPRLERWHAHAPGLVEEMMISPPKLAGNWAVYVSLKRRVGSHMVYAAEPELFSHFIPEMLEIEVLAAPAATRLQADRWARLEAMPHLTFPTIRTYLPTETHEAYQLVDTDHAENYYAERAPSGFIWLLPESVQTKLMREGS